MKSGTGYIFAFVATAALMACSSEKEPVEQPKEAPVEAAMPETAPVEAEAPAKAEETTAPAEEDVKDPKEEAAVEEEKKDPKKDAAVVDSKAATVAAKTAAAPAQKPAPAPAPVVAAVAPARPAAFAQCAVCHSDKQGQKSGFGPNLYGVAGTRSGALGGYSFSPAMKSAGVVWNRDSLDRFIESPQTVVPGTKMAFAGVKDAAKRKELVDYLLSLK